MFNPPLIHHSYGFCVWQLRGTARSFASSPSNLAAACSAESPEGSTSEASELPTGARKATLPHRGGDDANGMPKMEEPNQDQPRIIQGLENP